MKISKINLNTYRLSFNAGYSRNNNVAILGSSKDTDTIMEYLKVCSEVSKALVLSGKNVLTGCGDSGIMGRAYYAAAKNSTLNSEGKPEQNIVILKEPLWGDEDLENCLVMGTEKSEADRIEKFIQTANQFIIFPGGPGTIQEASTLISNNYYASDKDKKRQVILVGREYFKGLDELYQQMYKAGLIKCDPSELYKIVDTSDEIKDLTIESAILKKNNFNK